MRVSLWQLSLPTRRSSDLVVREVEIDRVDPCARRIQIEISARGVRLLASGHVCERHKKRFNPFGPLRDEGGEGPGLSLQRRSDDHTSELQSLAYLVCRPLL